MTRRALLLLTLSLLTLFGSGCSSGETIITVTESSTPPPLPDPSGPEGNLLSVEDFRFYTKEIDEQWEHDPAAVVGVLLGESDAARRSFELTVKEDGFAEAILTLDRLGDDSVRTLRYNLALQRHDDGTWEVLTGYWGQRCQEGRGHQVFSAKPCL